MLTEGFNQYIREIEVIKDESKSNVYPFNLNSVKNLDYIKLHPNVTFLVGENGSGKSTFLEAVAIAYGFNAEGGSKNFNFSTEDSHSVLSEYIKLSKGVKKALDGYFLRAESFYNVASKIDQIDRNPEWVGRPIIESYGGLSLHKQSHGESFMSLLLNRFSGNGIYILDEPEAALSPTRQLALLSRIHQLVKDDSQLIIATHSPLLLSYPNAVIYDLDNNYNEVKYEETYHYRISREFLNNPKKMLSILMED